MHLRCDILRADWDVGTPQQWESLLALAEVHGWRPRGTVAPLAPVSVDGATPSWNGSYGAGGGRLVSADLQALVLAWRHALAWLATWHRNRATPAPERTSPPSPLLFVLQPVLQPHERFGAPEDLQQLRLLVAWTEQAARLGGLTLVPTPDAGAHA